jgi:hypothetical protein
MTEIFQSWLAKHVNAPGSLGAGIHLPDGACVCHSSDEHFPVEKIEKILQQLAAAQSQFSGPELTPQWSTWVFDQGKVRCVLRPDGLLLGVAVRNDTDAAQNLDALSTEFLALQF